MDLDLVVFVVIVLLASKSCSASFALPSAIALRLGRVYKARHVPTDAVIAPYQGFSAGPDELRSERRGNNRDFVKKLDGNVAAHIIWTAKKQV